MRNIYFHPGLTATPVEILLPIMMSQNPPRWLGGCESEFLTLFFQNFCCIFCMAILLVTFDSYFLIKIRENKR